MGVSRSGKQLSAKLDRLADDYSDLPLAVIKEGSMIVKGSVLKLAPARLSGVGKRGARIGVRFNLYRGDDAAKSLVFATGPFHFIERDTKPHRIPKVRGKRARTRYAVIPGVGVRAYANHPGTKGKHPWARGVTAATPQVRTLLEHRGTLALKRIF